MSSDIGQVQTHLNGHSGIILAVFVVTSFFVICPVRISLPEFLQRLLLHSLSTFRFISPSERDDLLGRCLHITLGLETAPIVAVILLLATTTINGSTIRLGVKGDAYVKPYDVLVLFISLAYITIALDGTGALEALAFWVSKRGGSSGYRLFLYLYVFFLLTSCVIGNDPLILSGTPFLAYLTQQTGLEPTPWIFSEFMAANTASAVLVSSNPTNILIAGSFSLNYLTQFTKWTVLPSLVPAMLNYPVLLFMFRKRIPRMLAPIEGNPRSKLRNPGGAIFLSVLLVVTVVALVATSFVPGNAVQVWMVTAPAGLMAFFFDVGSDFISCRPTQQERTAQESHHATELQESGRVEISRENNESAAKRRNLGHPTPNLPSHISRRPSNQERTFLGVLRSTEGRFPGTTQTIRRLPILLLPFAMCEFILVRGLSQRGWIHVFAQGFANACTTPTRTVFFMGFVSAAFLCPLAGTNIGATIILVEIIRDPAFSSSPAVINDDRILLGAIYAVAMGSNLGAFSYTFCGSLAGLLWRGLLADKSIHVGALKFAMVNAIPLMMQTTLASVILLGQLYWFI